MSTENTTPPQSAPATCSPLLKAYGSAIVCGHKWTDETSYSQRQKEKKPHLWMARIAGMRLFVRRYTSGIYWTAHCYNPEHAEWSISVPTDTPEEAIAVAVADTARWLRSLADAVEVSSDFNEPSS